MTKLYRLWQNGLVEPIAHSFDESGRSEEELDDLVKQTQKAIREERRRNK